MEPIRERVASIIRAVGGHRYSEDLATAAILQAVEEDRATLMERVEQAEEDSLLMQGCNEVVIRDRAEDQEKLAKAEARERVLMKALQDTADTRDALKAREAAMVEAMDGLLKRCEDMEHSLVYTEGAKLFAASIAGTLDSIISAITGEETP